MQSARVRFAYLVRRRAAVDAGVFAHQVGTADGGYGR